MQVGEKYGGERNLEVRNNGGERNLQVREIMEEREKFEVRETEKQ